jgi:GDP-4-dehydro-6-deoxy-D-mannose reductase
LEKYLITGFSGFVSKHFLEYLEQLELPALVLGLDVNKPEFDISDYEHIMCSFKRVDLLDKNRVDNIIYQFQPNYILHLASYSSVAFSWKNPVASFTNNTNIFLNFLEQVRTLNLDCRILSIGSSEEYGNVNEENLPLKEDSRLNPVSPYAVARVSQEMLSKIYVDGYNMDIIMTRSFNHIGPGQKDVFVISSFAKQLVEIKNKKKTNELVTGDLSIVRDFLDVRDVVKAYYQLFKTGAKGEIYNICSGKGISLKEVIDKMTHILGIDIQYKVDPRLVRPSDNRIIIGSNEKIKSNVGWVNEISLDKSLEDIITYWQGQ